MLSELLPTELDGAFIGSLLLRKDAIFETPAAFTPKALGSQIAQRAYQAIDALTKAKRPVDVPIVAAEARFDEKQTQWLREAIQLGTLASVAPYAEKLLERYQRATLRTALVSAANELASDKPADQIVGSLLTTLSNVGSEEAPEVETMRDAAMQFLEHLENKTVKNTVIRTGFATTDALMKIRRGNLFVLAAQAGTGKSTLAVNFAENIAKMGGTVLVHSLEMDTVEIVGRVVARNAKINVESLFDDRALDQFALERAAQAIEAIGGGKGIPFLLNTRRHSLGEICRITEKQHRKHNLALVIVDYLQLIDVPLGKNASDEQRIGTISRTLKLLAQRLHVPILAVAQLNREIDKRGKEGEPFPTPKLSDLRGSGRIEQDANIVGFLHPTESGLFRLTISKQRLGRKNVHVNLVGQLNHAQFLEASRQDHA